MSSLKFNVVYEDAGEGWVYAHVPELPEVHTQGESLDQAREMVRDAIEMVLEASLNDAYQRDTPRRRRPPARGPLPTGAARFAIRDTAQRLAAPS